MALRGEKVDKPSYEILRSLNGGRTGVVRVADHKVFGQPCVQKTFSTLGLEDAAAHQEPRSLYGIDHPHVVKILEAQYDPEIPDAITIVTVYCEGECIAKALDQGYRFSVHQAVRLTTQVLDAMAHVHVKHNLIHRDPKPGNVFLNKDRSTAFLGDFGSAAPMGVDGTVAGIEGSPLYTPPEAGPINGRMAPSGDLYAVGLTLFEMLSGPFDYPSINPAKVDRGLTRGQRALPEGGYVFAPHVPEPLRRVARKAIRADPSKRYSSASEFIDALGGVRCIDWRHTGGEGLDGTWDGTWPPHLRVDARRRYRVESTVLAGGRDRGRCRLVALQAPSSTERFARFGVGDVTIDATDVGSMERFFQALETRAAHLAPAR